MTDISSIFEGERRRLNDEDERLRSRINIIDDPNDLTPDDAAEIDRAQRLQPGQSPAFTRQEADAAIRSYQADRALSVSPRLQRYLSEPSHAAMARDDTMSLSFWDYVNALNRVNTGAPGVQEATRRIADMLPFDSAARALQQGYISRERGRIASRLNPRGYGYDPARPADEVVTDWRMLNALRQLPHEPSQGLDAVFEQFPQLMGGFEAGFSRAMRDGANSWRQSQRDLNDTTALGSIETAANAPFAWLAATGGGAVQGVVGFAYEQEAGAAFDELTQMESAAGERMPLYIAGAYARRVGEINAVIEFVGLGAAAKLSGADELASYLTRPALRRAITRMGYRDAARRFAVGAGGAGLSEGLTELSQESVTIALGQLAQEAAGGEWEELTDEEIASRLWESFSVGATVGAVLGGIPAGGRFISDVEAIQNAQYQQEVFDALGESAAASRLRARSPGRYADAVDTLTANGPLSEVSIDADRFHGYFQDRGQDPFQVADDLRGVGADALRTAIETGDRLTIPTGTYAAQIAGSEAHKELARHVRMGPGQMTPAEVAARLELGVDLERAVAEAGRLQEEATVKLREMEGVRERIQAMFTSAEAYNEETNRRFTEYYAEALTVLAERAGVTPSALLDEISLSIEGPFDAASQATDLKQRGTGPDAGPTREDVWDIPEGVKLTERKRKIVEMATNGASNEWIADEMSIGDKLVSPENIAVTLSQVKKTLAAAGQSIPWETVKVGGRKSDWSTEEIMRLYNKFVAEGVPLRAGPGGDSVVNRISQLTGLGGPAISTRVSKARAVEALGEQATEEQIDLATLRRQWADEHVVTHNVPGGAPGDVQHSFVLSDGTLMEVGIGDDGNGAGSIEWTFLNRMIAGLPTEQLYAKMGEFFTPTLWREFTAGMHAIIERDVEVHQRPAYVFTPYTEAHRRAYKVLIDRFGIFYGYTFLEDQGVFHYFHPGAGIGANGQIRPQKDWEPNFAEVSKETDPAALADQQQEFYAAARELDAARNSARDLAASTKIQRQALARARAGDSAEVGGGAEARGLEQRASRRGPAGAAYMRHLWEGGDLRSATIKLFEGRDLSTPIHEGGHLFLEVMQLLVGKVAKLPAEELTATQQQLRDDWQTVLDWFGVTAEQWSAMNLEEKRPHHERFARANEAYFMTGQAPTPKLKQLFAVFKRWLTWIYKSALALDVNLTPEMRQVLDRMVATDEAIQQARAQQGAGPRDVVSRENWGGTDKQYERYLRNIEAAREAALEDLQREAMGALIADRTRWYRSEEARARRTVIAELDEDPAWQAYDVLSGRKVPEGGEGPLRLSPAIIVEEYGQAAFDALPPEVARADADALMAQAVEARKTLRQREPTRMTARIQQLGGVRDPGGDVRNIIGDPRGRPGLINNATGLDPDEMALRLWEEGYFGVPPGRLFQGDAQSSELLALARLVVEEAGGSAQAEQRAIEFFREQARTATHPQMRADRESMIRAIESGEYRLGKRNQYSQRVELAFPELYGAWPSGLFQGERPTVREFLDKLDGDVRGTEPAYKESDAEIVAAREEAEKVREYFSQQGIDINAKESDLREQIKKIAAREDTQGVDPELAASIFGFQSGEELLKALSALRPRREVIEERTRQRMLQEYGDPFANGEVMGEALRAAHREAQAKVIELELDAIERALGVSDTKIARPVSRVAKDIAEAQIERMTVRQIRKFEWFLGNERRHAKEATQALADGRMDDARTAKHRQLVNFHLYRLARNAADELDRAQRYFRKLETSAGTRGNIDPDYLDQIDGLLEQYEFRKVTQRTEQRRINLAEWARRMEAQGLGHLIAIDPRILEEARTRPYSQLQLDEVRALVDAVKNIEHLGRLKERLLDAADKRAFRETVSGLADQMNETGPISQDTKKNYSPSAIERAQEGLRKAHAEMTRMEFLFRHLDGKANGPLWRALWLPFAKAADKESAMMRDAVAAMEEIWSSAYSRTERARMFKKRIAMPDLPVGGASHYTKSELLAIALNLGNEGNVRALVDGFGWGGGRELAAGDYAIAKEQIVSALSRVLEPRDWLTVQRIWDLIGAFRDEAFALQKDLTGIEPQAVEAAPLKLDDGTTLQGGYYPLKFDRTRDLRVDRAESKQEAQEMWGSNWSKPMTRKGHLIERVGSGGRPVKLSLSVFSEHVQNVVHDIAYRRAVVDVDRIITDPQFSETFVNVAGRPMYDQLRPWLQAIAADRVDPSAMMWKFLLNLRGNVAIAAMGYRVSTATQQLVGVLQAIPMLGSGEMAGALAQLVRNPRTIAEKARVISSKSEFMRTRMQTLDRDIRETIDRMERTDPLHPIRHNAFALVGMFDWAVSSVVWTAAYNKALRGDVTGIASGDEQAAIYYGDTAVRNTQSAGLRQDLPAIMRGSEVNKLLTMFFSYFSVLYNWTAYDQIIGVRKGRIPPHVFMANMALIYVISPLIAEALAGRWEPREGEDEEERNMRLAAVVARFPFATVPVIRDVANVVGTGFEYQLSPVGSAPGQIADALTDVARGRTFESEATTKRAVTAIGYAFGLPTPQAWIMIDYLADKLEGEEEGFDPVEAFLRDSR